MGCSTAACHGSKTTSTGHATTAINRHIGRVACQTCHIATYARNAADTAGDESTEVYRSWPAPEWNTALNRYEPTIARGGNLKPVYRFWNGTSWNYSVNEPAWLDPVTGLYATSRPEGSIGEVMSKLYPFKYKKALQPIADSPNVLVALDTAVYFSTGNYDSAVKAGLVNMGYSSMSYWNVETDTYQLITHEVMPKGSALTCNQCHTAGATQMNLKSLGYAMKGTQATTCTQCHGQKSLPTYTSLHQKHVTDKQYDCSWCHTFSRPERNLKMPPTVDTTPPVVTAFSIPSSSATLTVPISTLTAADNVAVTGYMVTEAATKPSAGAAGWSSTKPASYTFSSAGTKTLYAWAKDGAGNVSAGISASTVISVSSGTPDIAVKTSLGFGKVRIGQTKRIDLKVTNRGSGSLVVTNVELVGTQAAAFRASKKSFTVNAGEEYRLRMEFTPTSAVLYQATLRLYSNDPDTPVTQTSLTGTGTK
jgi:hypothetical protein